MIRLDVKPLSPALIAIGAVLALAPSGFAQSYDSTMVRVPQLERQIAGANVGMQRLRMAQLFNRPPADVPNANPQEGDQVEGAPDATGLDVRIDRLENQVRALNGQIEQTQFELRRIEDQLKKFQQEVDLRWQENARPSSRLVPPKRADLVEGQGAVAYPPAGSAVPTGSLSSGGLAPRPKRADAFDPQTDPTAPGAPRSLGNLSSGPIPPDNAPMSATSAPTQVTRVDGSEDSNGPLDLSRGANGPVRRVGVAPATTLPPASGASASSDLPGPSAVTPAGAIIGPGPAGGARGDFDVAISFLKQRQYETAESSFAAFIQKYPKDRLVPDAVYYLGETYTERGRHREAAEQYLKVATNYAKSSRAPEGLVRLGMSLNALGAKDQACATFGEVSRKYPNASAAVKNSVDRESKRAKC